MLHPCSKGSSHQVYLNKCSGPSCKPWHSINTDPRRLFFFSLSLFFFFFLLFFFNKRLYWQSMCSCATRIALFRHNYDLTRWQLCLFGYQCLLWQANVLVLVCSCYCVFVFLCVRVLLCSCSCVFVFLCIRVLLCVRDFVYS